MIRLYMNENFTLVSMSLDAFFAEGHELYLRFTGARARNIYFHSNQTQQALADAKGHLDAWNEERDEITDAMPMRELLERLQNAMQHAPVFLWPELNHVIQARLMSIRMYCYAIPEPPLVDESALYAMLHDLEEYISYYMTPGYRDTFMPGLISTGEPGEVGQQQYEASKSLEGVIAQHAILQARLLRLREARAMPLLTRHSKLLRQVNDDVLGTITRAALAEPSVIENRPPPYFRSTRFLS
jgi:hypothetical protein